MEETEKCDVRPYIVFIALVVIVIAAPAMLRNYSSKSDSFHNIHVKIHESTQRLIDLSKDKEAAAIAAVCFSSIGVHVKAIGEYRALKRFIVRKARPGRFADFSCRSYMMRFFAPTAKQFSDIALGSVTLHECYHQKQCINGNDPHDDIPKFEAQTFLFVSRVLVKAGGKAGNDLIRSIKQVIIKKYTMTSGFYYRDRVLKVRVDDVKIKKLYKTQSATGFRFIRNNLLFAAYSEIYRKQFTLPEAQRLERRLYTHWYGNACSGS